MENILICFRRGPIIDVHQAKKTSKEIAETTQIKVKNCPTHY